MGRKGGLASIFSSSSSRHSKPAAQPPSPPWPWPSCATKPQTASFRGPGSGAGDDGRPCTTATDAGRSRRGFDDAAAAAAEAGGAGGGGGGMLRPPSGAAPGDEMYKTVNSVYFDDAADGSCRFSFFRDDCGASDVDDGVLDDDGSFSTTTASEEWSEAVIRSLGRTSTDRFFFDAGPPTPAAAASSSILAASPSPSPGRPVAPPPPSVDEAPTLLQTALPPSSAACELVSVSDDDDDDGVSLSEAAVSPSPSTSLVEESVAVAVDSEDPFGDFRASMGEMVAAHGLRDWPALQEMLLWYLRINGKHHHALIVGAFVDLLVGLATSTAGASPSATPTATMTTTTTTACCCCSSSSTTSSSSGASSGGGGATTTRTSAAAAAAMDEQCGRSAGASCSSASSDLEEEEAAAEERSVDGHCSDALDSSCS